MARRPSRTPLNRDRVLAAAVRIADAEGVDAVTMRRVADDLDCEAMSLYYHLDGKRALLDGLAETVLRELVAATSDDAITAGAGDWRDVVRRRCLAARAVMLRHPWAPPLIIDRADALPTTFAVYEQFVATLIDAGFTYDLAHRGIHTLGSMIMGFTQEVFDPSPGDAADTSADAFEQVAAAMPHLATLAQMETHEVEGALSVCDTQAEFEFTLGLILDGLDRARQPAPRA